MYASLAFPFFFLVFPYSFCFLGGSEIWRCQKGQAIPVVMALFAGGRSDSWTLKAPLVLVSLPHALLMRLQAMVIYFSYQRCSLIYPFFLYHFIIMGHERFFENQWANFVFPSEAAFSRLPADRSQEKFLTYLPQQFLAAQLSRKRMDFRGFKQAYGDFTPVTSPSTWEYKTNHLGMWQEYFFLARGSSPLPLQYIHVLRIFAGLYGQVLASDLGWFRPIPRVK